MTAGLFAAASGIRANQFGLNVVSNNIANLNTVAFKSSKANFHNIFAETVRGGTSPGGNIGGTNPIQIGNGTALADVSMNFNQGGQTYTGKSTDLMISGNGFFTLQFIEDNGDSSYKLTRAGNFELDADGYLTAATGNRVLGTRSIDSDNPATVKPVRVQDQLTVWKRIDSTTGDVIEAQIGDAGTTAMTATAGNTVTSTTARVSTYGIGKDGALVLTYSNGDRLTVRDNAGSGTPPTTRELSFQTSEGFEFSPSNSGLGVDGALQNPDNIVYPEELQIRIAKVTNPKGLVSEDNSMFSVGANSGDTSMGVGNLGGRGFVQSGALESSNVDLGGEFVQMILYQRGLEAASKAITTQNQSLQSILNIL